MSKRKGTHIKSNAPSLRSEKKRRVPAQVVSFYDGALKADDPIEGKMLREKATEVAEINEQVFEVCARMMWVTEHDPECLGIAAPQVGVWSRIFTVKDENKRVWCFVNPTVEPGSGAVRVREREGCFSFPNMWSMIERWSSVVVRGLAPSGDPIERTFTGVTARAAQHELDHLEGVLIDHGDSFEPVPGRVAKSRQAVRG